MKSRLVLSVWVSVRCLESAAFENIFRARQFAGSGAERRFTAVDALTFPVEHGETLAVVGESVCEKPTLALMILQFIEPDASDAAAEYMRELLAGRCARTALLLRLRSPNTPHGKETLPIGAALR